VVLLYIMQARARRIAIVFITHNVHHAYPVGDRFTILNRGASYGTFPKEDATREEVLVMSCTGSATSWPSSPAPTALATWANRARPSTRAGTASRTASGGMADAHPA
jgi:ABC-type sugar transport system ATPase subunit